jgi:hypothetical protein
MGGGKKELSANYAKEREWFFLGKTIVVTTSVVACHCEHLNEAGREATCACWIKPASGSGVTLQFFRVVI